MIMSHKFVITEETISKYPAYASFITSRARNKDILICTALEEILKYHLTRGVPIPQTTAEIRQMCLTLPYIINGSQAHLLVQPLSIPMNPITNSKSANSTYKDNFKKKSKGELKEEQKNKITRKTSNADFDMFYFPEDDKAESASTKSQLNKQVKEHTETANINEKKKTMAMTLLKHLKEVRPIVQEYFREWRNSCKTMKMMTNN